MGDFIEKLTIVFSNGDSETIEIMFTNWCKVPCFGERIALKCKAAYKNEMGEIENFANDRYLYGKTYNINPTNKIKLLKLPNCPNIHIYAISLGVK